MKEDWYINIIYYAPDYDGGNPTYDVELEFIDSNWMHPEHSVYRLTTLDEAIEYAAVIALLYQNSYVNHYEVDDYVSWKKGKSSSYLGVRIEE